MNIAIDLGGTSVRAASVDGSRVVHLISEPCRADKPENEVLEHICSLIDRLFTPEIKAIGVGVPSVVDAERGIVYDVVGIPSWKEVHLKDILEERYKIPAYINNDCNCFALGVSAHGEARGYSSAVCVTSPVPARSGASSIWTGTTSIIAAAVSSSGRGRQARMQRKGPWQGSRRRWNCGMNSGAMWGSCR